MASIIERKRSTCVKYYYQNESGESVCHWESYNTRLEASQRKLVIDEMQKNGDHEGLRVEAMAYKLTRASEKYAKGKIVETDTDKKIIDSISRDDSNITFDAFFDYWLPKITLMRTYTPATLTSYRRKRRLVQRQ